MVLSVIWFAGYLYFQGDVYPTEKQLFDCSQQFNDWLNTRKLLDSCASIGTAASHKLTLHNYIEDLKYQRKRRGGSIYRILHTNP